MEHLRTAVAIDPKDSNTFDPIRKPASERPSGTANAEKRTDPFQFGSRYLEEGDDIFEFNAWDHVETDETYKEFAEEQYAKQREAPVNEFDKNRFNSDPAKWWNKFYGHNTTNFFKNRKWLQQEFPILSTLSSAEAPPCVLLEVGAGAGNSAFPILAQNQNPKLKIHACDFSKKAVELIRENELYDQQHLQADVWDVAQVPTDEDNGLPPGLEEGSVDVVLMIFIFSALSPKQWDQATRNIWRVLKPGGLVLFRDYGRGDLAQVRFKKGRYLEENFYVRGDGTRVYFFEKAELQEIWGGDKQNGNSEDASNEEVEKLTEAVQEMDLASGTGVSPRPKFEVLDIGVDRRMLVNRQRKLKMYRCWMQAKFRKPEEKSEKNNAVAAVDLESNSLAS
ncbi:methyltransferase [Aulographum hederae CBS 113979]|uniref:tRNA N(3)-methylcytidine methyltransferase n=1 Tax=Aulographum hederae CBS 113979 TaxID=1176131 RepID=A0A6G1H373_9PEZI|nr:methyltransferase [Aulographum hederae CBS 113979]